MKVQVQNLDPELDNVDPENLEPTDLPPENLELDPENSDPVLETPPETVSREDYLKLQSQNERLLFESKKNKADKRKLQEDKLLAEGKKDELLDQQRQRIKNLEERDMVANINTAIQSEAGKRNCPHWKHLLSVGDTSLLNYDPDTEQVTGVENFFDAHEVDPEYGLYFKKAESRDPNIEAPGIDNPLDYRKDPMAYLDSVRKNKPGEYAQAVAKLQREGLVG